MTPTPVRYACALVLGAFSLGAQSPAINLWPGVSPGDAGSIGVEHDTTTSKDHLTAGRPVIRIGDVSVPTITVYRPSAEKDTGATVVVCPGGGFHILAMDLEGTEVCEWLNSLGITGVLLKYRVPVRQGRPDYEAPLQAAQRAVGIVRSHSKEWSIDPDRIGVLGFSAGGHLCATLVANSAARTYPRVDDADDASCRPDFQILIYPGGILAKGQGLTLAPHAAVTAATPPTFLVMAEDDPVGPGNVLAYAIALKEAKVPFELHLYPTGGHGYGLRPTKDFVTTWPARARDWMKSLGILDRK